MCQKNYGNWWEDPKPKKNYYASFLKLVDITRRVAVATVLSIFVVVIFIIGIYKLLVDISKS